MHGKNKHLDGEFVELARLIEGFVWYAVMRGAIVGERYFGRV